MNDRPERDVMLEQALASLSAPPAGERFHERLWSRIDAAGDAVLQDAPDEALVLDALEAPPARERFHERLWERIDAAEAPAAARRAPRRWTFRRPRLAAVAFAAAAVAAVIAVTLVGWPLGREHGGVGGPPPAVAQVLENVRLRLGSCESIGAVFTYERAGAPTFRGRIVATSDGRVRTEAVANDDGSWSLPPADARLADTAGLHVEVTNMPDGTRTEAWNAAGKVSVARTAGLAPGAPDGAGSGLFPAQNAGQMSALAVAGAKVTSSTYEGRAVLVVRAPVDAAAEPTSGVSPGAAPASGVPSPPTPRYDTISMTVDRDTWLPVRVERSYRGTVVEAWGFSEVRLDPLLMASDFTVKVPDDATVVSGGDQGFHRVTLQQTGTEVRRRLYVPGYLPDGFELSLVAVRARVGTGQYPVREDTSSVASLVYRQGFRSVVVTTRPVVAGADSAVDPFAGSPAATASATQASAATASAATKVPMGSGWLAGATAHVSARSLGLPHLWAVQDGLLVTVAGDVTRRELLEIAGSLEPYSVWRAGQVFDAYTTATTAYDLSTLSDLYSRGIEIDGRSYAAEETDEALITNSEKTDYFVSGKVVSTFVGDGLALWEAWPGDYTSFGGWYTPEAVAEVVTTRGDKVAREDFFWISGPSVKIGQESPHPEQLGTPPGVIDTAAAARRLARAFAAALRRKDAAALARLSAPDVAFLDVGYGDHGRRPALRRRYARMFAFPADLAFGDLRAFSGPGWAVVRWTAASTSLGYDGATGLTVLEFRDGRVARTTLYCDKAKMPFR